MSTLFNGTFRSVPLPNRFVNTVRPSEGLIVTEKRVTDNYTMLKLLVSPQLGFHDIEMWCITTGCGKRVNRTSFAFKTDAELTMFTLRWAPVYAC
jgi:hypothetical protein